MLKIDINSVKMYDDKYLSYRVVDEEGNMICVFFGPMSLSAAGTFIREHDKKKLVQPLDCYENYIIE